MKVFTHYTNLDHFIYGSVQWEYQGVERVIVKGFAMNDDLLKRAGGGNYFDELLARVISAPVKRCSIVRYWRFMPQ